MERLLKNGKIRVALAMAIVAVMFGTLMIVNLLTPPIGDDYYYSKGLIFGTTIPVRNISDAFRSAANMYKMHSGRTFTCFYYLIFSMLGKTAVAFIYSALYMLTVWLMYLLIRGKGENSICLFVGINLSLWVFVPALGQDIFWWTGAANYLLPMPLILGMLLIYQRGCDSKKDGAVKCLLIGLLGVISGWQFENSSIAVPFVTLAYICLWKYKGLKIPKWAWSGFAGSMLGYILLVAAPGNFQRYESEIENAGLSLPFKFAEITYYWIMFVGILTALFVVGVIKCRRNNPGAVCEGIIFAGAALVTAYCMIAAPYPLERTWFITVSLMIVGGGYCFEGSVSLEADFLRNKNRAMHGGTRAPWNNGSGYDPGFVRYSRTVHPTRGNHHGRETKWRDRCFRTCVRTEIFAESESLCALWTL